MIYKILLPILISALLFVIWLSGGKNFIQNNLGEMTNRNTIVSLTTAPTFKKEKENTITTTPTGAEVNQIYTNTKYGFTISYPKKYKVLTSKDDLYGWDKAIALFYSGGQSYDVAVEVWNSEAEYKEKYVDVPLTVFQANGKFITLYDETKEPENKTLVNSFKLLN